jgi:HEAT repeat protein
VAFTQGECPHCRTDLGGASTGRSYTEKLLRAFRHPEPETVKRVVWILGEQRNNDAILPLLNLLRSTRDIYLSAAICDALGQIGGCAALPDLQYHATQGSVVIRRAARRAIEMIKIKGTSE